MPHDQTRPENPSSAPPRSSSLRCCSLPSVSMDFPHTPGPPAPPTGVDTLLSACLECASASFLRGAGASLARAADSSVVGLPRDGGAPTVGEESEFSARLGPFDSFVDVVPGGLGGEGGIGEVWVSWRPTEMGGPASTGQSWTRLWGRRPPCSSAQQRQPCVAASNKGLCSLLSPSRGRLKAK